MITAFCLACIPFNMDSVHFFLVALLCFSFVWCLGFCCDLLQRTCYWMQRLAHTYNFKDFSYRFHVQEILYSYTNRDLHPCRVHGKNRRMLICVGITYGFHTVHSIYFTTKSKVSKIRRLREPCINLISHAIYSLAAPRTPQFGPPNRLKMKRHVSQFGPCWTL